MEPCWHRPGRMTRRGTMTCRHCGVAVEFCPCTDAGYRHYDPKCLACRGSMWVAVVRSWRAKLLELVA
jgi:hypothetical protein